jgi:hypothetical protein
MVVVTVVAAAAREAIVLDVAAVVVAVLELCWKECICIVCYEGILLYP